MDDKPVEIKQFSKREIWVGKNKFYLRDDNILVGIEVMTPDKKLAALENDAIFKLANLVDGKVDIVIDISETGQPTPEARNIYKDAIEHEKFGKVAIVGMNPVNRIIAHFVMGRTNKKDLRLFKTKKEAFEWLKE
jgi:hypothetical protein